MTAESKNRELGPRPEAGSLDPFPAATEGVLPDPSLSASIYASGSLDEVIHRVVHPLYRELGTGEGRDRLWMVRYHCRGVHLKLRIHTPEQGLDRWRSRLGELTKDLFGWLGRTGRELLEPSGPEGPAIDVEDEAGGEPLDRQLLWTTYRRSHVSLGGGPLLDDDAHVDRMTACLARGGQLALRTVQPDEDGTFPAGPRRTAYLKALIAGLAELASAGARQRYLTYHRDWLLRFFTDDRGAEEQALLRLDEQVRAMESTVVQLKGVAEPHWEGASGRRDGGTPWHDDLGRLVDALERLPDDERYRADPFTDSPVFPSLFKVFHGLANQLGVQPPEEAYLQHLLLQVATTPVRHDETAR